MIADAPSTVTLMGGTHNVGAPPFPFLARTFLPALARMGPRVELAIDRAERNGFDFTDRARGLEISAIERFADLASKITGGLDQTPIGIELFEGEAEQDD